MLYSWREIIDLKNWNIKSNVDLYIDVCNSINVICGLFLKSENNVVYFGRLLNDMIRFPTLRWKNPFPNKKGLTCIYYECRILTQIISCWKYPNSCLFALNISNIFWLPKMSYNSLGDTFRPTVVPYILALCFQNSSTRRKEINERQIRRIKLRYHGLVNEEEAKGLHFRRKQ